MLSDEDVILPYILPYIHETNTREIFDSVSRLKNATTLHETKNFETIIVPPFIGGGF